VTFLSEVRPLQSFPKTALEHSRYSVEFFAWAVVYDGSLGGDLWICEVFCLPECSEKRS
jgi:hypothetical protein